MAFIRKRRTSSGNLSTTLVEPYRDSAGKPRQRVLANLYGCETTLEALAKLSAQRLRLRQERKEIESMLAKTAEWAAVAVRFATDPAEFKRAGITAQEYQELSQLMKGRKKAEARLDRIDALLGRIQKDGAVIRKHVDGTEQDVQKAIKDYQEKLSSAEAAATVAAVMAHQVQQEATRLSLPGEARSGADTPFFKFLSKQMLAVNHP